MERKRAEFGTASDWLRRVLLSLFFFAGIAAGILAAQRTSPNVGQELSEYLNDYLTLAQQRGTAFADLHILMWSYFCAPLLVLFSAFFSVGVVAVPLLAAGFGFVHAYAVSCLLVSFGARGIWLALGLFGLRCFITVPCFFVLAETAWPRAAALCRFSVGKGRVFPSVDRRQFRARAAGVCLALFLGACVDFQCSPFLLRTLLERVIL